MLKPMNRRAATAAIGAAVVAMRHTPKNTFRVIRSMRRLQPMPFLLWLPDNPASCRASVFGGTATGPVDLHIEVRNGEIWLDPSIISPVISESRAHAFDAATRKARELAWIV